MQADHQPDRGTIRGPARERIIQVSHRNRHRLTKTEMAEVESVIDKAEHPMEALVGALKTTFNILLAPEEKTWDDFGPDNQIPSSQYAIPDDQWQEIAEALKVRTDALAAPLGVNDAGLHILLDWMNVGPSSFTATQELAS
jgi:hypothetical protein